MATISTTSSSLLESATLVKASGLSVYDAAGKEVPFGSLYKNRKTIIVFIRHFFCGSCQAYVIQLASVRKEALENAETSIVIVGCGEWQPIQGYAETTGFAGAIYADPTRTLFHLFDLPESLARTPADTPKRSYLAGRSALGNTLHSIWAGPLKNPKLIGKQGNISQLGGEFILGPGDQCIFASRMEHTEDHIEVVALMDKAGVSYP